MQVNPFPRHVLPSLLDLPRPLREISSSDFYGVSWSCVAGMRIHQRTGGSVEYPITNAESWPELNWDQWKETADTLHMFMQIVGKTRVALTPVQNHWWNVPFYLTARGLTTSAMPVPTGGLLDIEFDFVAHELICRRSTGAIERLALCPQPVASFYAGYLTTLSNLGVRVHIDPMPVEVKEPVRFHEDTEHKSYDSEAVL